MYDKFAISAASLAFLFIYMIPFIEKYVVTVITAL